MKRWDDLFGNDIKDITSEIGLGAIDELSSRSILTRCLHVLHSLRPMRQAQLCIRVQHRLVPLEEQRILQSETPLPRPASIC
jgi:hypothetical protein